jgi:hypothetical protein
VSIAVEYVAARYLRVLELVPYDGIAVEEPPMKPMLKGGAATCGADVTTVTSQIMLRGSVVVPIIRTPYVVTVKSAT